MSGQPEQFEQVPFPAGGGYVPEGFVMPPAAPAPQAPPVPQQMQLAGAPMPVRDRAVSAPVLNDPAVNEAMARIGKTLGMTPADPTPDELLRLIHGAKGVPFDTLLATAEFLVDVAVGLVNEAAKAGRPITFKQSLQTLQRITDLLANAPGAFAQLVTMFR